jgi:hypothetical protein
MTEDDGAGVKSKVSPKLIEKTKHPGEWNVVKELSKRKA